MKMSWLTALKFFGPMVLGFTKAAPIAPFIVSAIESAEALVGATGTEKLAHAKALVRTSVAAVNAQAGKQVVDPNVPDKIIDDAVALVISITNAFKRSPATVA